MGLIPKNLNWSVIGPVAAVAAVLIAILWLDAAHGGAAKPQPLLGAVGTPVRGTYTAPTATAIGAVATAKPKPTFAGVASGDAGSRDFRRRADLLTLVLAANAAKAKDGTYPITSKGANVQTLCAFQNVDIGCKLKDYIPGGVLPLDPFGDSVKNGYWYSSDGQTAKLYAALEGDIDSSLKCATDDIELKKKLNLICIQIP